MVDDGGNTAVGIIFRVIGSFVLVLAEVEVDGLVGKTEFFKNIGNFPAIRLVRVVDTMAQRQSTIR
jgi:hypothetical protein